MVAVNYFEKPVSNNKLSKIYVVKHRSDIVYVGTTFQAISSRLRSGLQADGKNGYYGYKWKHLKSVDLFIFCLFEKKLRAEAMEAEIVYLIRNKTGEWPKYQTEIHFHKAERNEKKIADLIYAKTR